jgi:DNA (cytosine-5)-methyltransferase 1
VFHVVDLFAGPGGLGEGFAGYRDKHGHKAFKSAIAFEKDRNSWATLKLRHFFREFDDGHAPTEYYQVCTDQSKLGALYDAYPLEADAADRAAIHIELSPKNRKEVRQRIDESVGQADEWVLVGGPPCQAYSLAGRSRMANNPNFDDDERHFLYKEYLQTIADHEPPVFVLENVKGLLSANVRGNSTVERILTDLAGPSAATGGNNSLRYRLYSLFSGKEIGDHEEVRSLLVKSEDYGIPQARHRVFVLGVRDDLNGSPGALRASKRRVLIEDVISDLPKLRSGISGREDTPEGWADIVRSFPLSTVLRQMPDHLDRQIATESFETYLSHFDRFPRERIRSDYRKGQPSEVVMSWYRDPMNVRISSHETRSHMPADIHRYFFASVFGAAYRRSPNLRDFPENLLPNHRSAKNSINSKYFGDRFRVQLTGSVSSTIVSHISKDGHYYIHPDPIQCRSLTVREAARLQTFPDNYVFLGGRTSQYHQVGNAVPPLLANQIAEVVAEFLRGGRT